MNGRLLKLTFPVLLWLTLHCGAVAQTDEPNVLQPQDEKALTKQWKQKARYYKKNPLVLMAREQAFAAEVGALQQRLDTVSAAYNGLEQSFDADKLAIHERKAAAEQRADSLAAVNDTLRMMLTTGAPAGPSLGRFAPKGANPTLTTPATNLAGIQYYVQIGAVRKGYPSFTIPAQMRNFIIDSSASLNRYLMGVFQTLAEAETFRADVRGFGIRDAFVVAYQNGQPVSLRQARKSEQIARKAAPMMQNLQNDLTQRKAEMDSLKRQIEGLKKVLSESTDEQGKLKKDIADKEKSYQLLEAQMKQPAAAADGRHLTGFSVQLYSGSQAGAHKVLQHAQSAFAPQPAEQFFEGTYYKVKVGRFAAFDEALSFRALAAKHYADAFIRNEFAAPAAKAPEKTEVQRMEGQPAPMPPDSVSIK